MPGRLLTTPEVAERLGVSRQTAHTYLSRGVIAAQKTPGGQYRVEESAVLAYLRQNGGRAVAECRVLAVVNQKGGVGKTTTTVNLAVNLAALGERVLVVDSDPQANATMHFGLSPYQLEHTLYDVLHNPLHGAGFALQAVLPGLDLLPATLDLAAVEQELAGVFQREQLLKKALAPIVERYNFLLIDCPPALGLLTLNALMAATEVLIPLQVEPFAVRGMAQLQRTIDIVQSGNPALQIGGIVCTMYDARNNLSPAIEQSIRTQFGGDVFATIIPRNVALSEAAGAGQSIQAYAASSRGAEAYRALAEEVRRRGQA